MCIVLKCQHQHDLLFFLVYFLTILNYLSLYPKWHVIIREDCRRGKTLFSNYPAIWANSRLTYSIRSPFAIATCYSCSSLSWVIFFPCSGNPCQSDICLHGGSCSVDASGTFLCSCREGFTGHKCELKGNDCHRLSLQAFLVALRVFTQIRSRYPLL